VKEIRACFLTTATSFVHIPPGNNGPGVKKDSLAYDGTTYFN